MQPAELDDLALADRVQSGKVTRRERQRLCFRIPPHYVHTLAALGVWRYTSTNIPITSDCAHRWSGSPALAAQVTDLLRSAWQTGALRPHTESVSPLDPAVAPAAIDAWLRAVVDTDLITAILTDTTVEDRYLQVLAANQHAPASGHDTAVTQALDDIDAIDDEMLKRAHWARVVPILQGHEITPATAARVVATAQTIFPGVRTLKGGTQPWWVTNLPGWQRQPYAEDVQFAALDYEPLAHIYGGWLAENPHATPAVLTRIGQHLLTRPMPKGQHRTIKFAVSYLFTNPNVDIPALIPFISKEKRIKIKDQISHAMYAKIPHYIAPDEEIDEDGFIAAALTMMVMGRSTNWLTGRIKDTFTLDELTGFAASDDPLRREFASRVLLDAVNA